MNTSTPKHTPGPWEIEGPKEQEAMGGQTYFTIRPTSLNAPVEFTGFFYPHSIQSAERMEANARLISAAPDLLEACKAIVLLGEGFGQMTHVIAQAESAIKKATQ